MKIQNVSWCMVIAMLVNNAYSSMTADTFTDSGGSVTLQMHETEEIKHYTLTTTAQLRDNEPADKTRTISEKKSSLCLRSGNELFDALYALTLDDACLNAVQEIRDGSFDVRESMNRPYFQTGEKWTYVWTRDISYSVDLGMASLDPQRCLNSLLFKTTQLKKDIQGQCARQIVQDTGSGGSYPVSTDRVVWAIGAAKLLHFLDDPSRTKFLDDAWQILHDTIEHDRHVIFDSEDGLYRGEQSFLDWREQTYPGWTKDNVAAIAKSKALSTNVGHYQILKTAAELARQKGLADKAKQYNTWADALKAAINQEFYLESKGLYCSIILDEPVKIKLNRFDLLGQSLAILYGIADKAQSEKIIANYPQGKYGPPVVWPQEQTVPIYHNQAIWPFVTAYWLKAAKAAGNSAAVDQAVYSLVRGTALNLSNMENFDFVTGQAFAKVNGIEGPVINSRRQLWSVAGYMAMVQDVIFGMETDWDGIRFLPCITGRLHRDYFNTSQTLQLQNFQYRGKNIHVTIHLPALSEKLQGIYAIEKITLNNKPIEMDFIPAGNLAKDNHWEVRLTAANKAADKINMIDQVNPKNIFGPRQPQWKGAIAVENGNLKLNYDADGEKNVRFNIYRNGQLCAEAITETQWTDPDSSADKTSFYTVEAFYPGYDNCSHVTPVKLYCPEENRIEIPAAMMKNTGGNLVDNHHFENWGKPEHTLQVDSFKVNQSGRYLLSVKYSNGLGPINTGVTCGVKRIEIIEAGGSKPVAAAYLIMPHTAEWKRYMDSTSFEAKLRSGINYTIKIFEDVYARNMSYFDHYEPYKGLGSGMTPCNFVNIASLEAIAINYKPAT